MLLLLVSAGALHALFAWALQGVLEMDWESGELPTTEGVMEVALVPPEEMLLPEDAVEQLEQMQDKRLVKNHRSVNEREPDDTKNISEIDQKVDKETKAPNVKTTPPGNPTPSGNPSPKSTPTDSEQDGKDSESTPKTDAPADAKGEQGEGSEAADSDVAPDDQGRVANKAGAASKNSPAGLAGSRQALQNTFGRLGTYDDLDDVEEGSENLLNTKRNKYASFFNRVRDAVSEEWDPEKVHRARDPEGNIYGNKNRKTTLRILLNRNGSVHRVYVVKSSGADHLDEEAIRAVRTAAPFMNPPAGLIGESGKIDFTFSFILMMDGSTRIFRYRK